MLTEDFASGDSLLHRADPRIKIILSIMFSIVAALATDRVVMLAALGMAAALCAAAGVLAAAVRTRLLYVNGFVIFLWLFLPFTTSGHALAQLGPLAVTEQGVAIALDITLKANAIVLANIALLSTSSIFTLVHGMNHMYLPPRLIHLFFFSFRYLHVLRMEYSRLRAAMKVRCFAPATNAHTYRSYSYLVGMLLVNSYDRSERVYAAMKCRGFKGEYRVLKHFHLTPTDIAAAIILGLVIIFLAYIEWGPGVF